MKKSKNIFLIIYFRKGNFFNENTYRFLSSTDLTNKFNDMNDNKFENSSFCFDNKTLFKKVNNRSLNKKESKFKLFNKVNDEENEIKDNDKINKNNNQIIFVELEENKYMKLSKAYFNNKDFKNTCHITLNKINSNLCEIFPSSNKGKLLENNYKKSLKLKSNTKQILNTSTKKKEEKCKCKNSQCLKLYCECFSNGRICNKNCICIGCKNTLNNEEMRKSIYKEIVLKNPKAIQKIKSIKRSWTCHCKNSNCKKNYCDCFQNKKFCSSKCKCIDCENKIILNNNEKRRGLDHFPKNKKRKSKKKNNKIDLENSFEKIYTPKKRKYRDLNSENKNNFSTASITQLNYSLENPKKKIKICESKEKNIFKKLNMDDISESNGIFN